MDSDGLRAYFTDDLAAQWGERVKARRKELRLTQAQLAELLGSCLSIQGVSHLELGRFMPRDHVKAAVALALVCEIGDLFPAPERKRFARFGQSAA